MMCKTKRPSVKSKAGRSSSKYTYLSETTDLLVEIRQCHARIDELTRQRDAAIEAKKEAERDNERKVANLHAEIRRLAALGESFYVGYNPHTEELSCGNCGWIIEGDFTYCPNCAGRIDYTVARDEDDWRYDAWKERDL